MSLSTIWTNNKIELIEKKIGQIISIAGNGKLKDSSITSSELRDFLKIVPSDKLKEYANECLDESFEYSGFVLQDIVNEIGNRIGFKVENGLYQGTKANNGYDGLWKSPELESILVEVKTTDAYRIDLQKIASYRERLISQNNFDKENFSILIVVGRQDTGDLEAQVRGSRYAWDIRIISVNALVRLMSLKEELEDPKVNKKIFDVLIPREYTKLDSIIEIIFSTAESVKQIEEVTIDEFENETNDDRKVNSDLFREGCIDILQNKLEMNFVKRTRSGYSTIDELTGLICAVSKEYIRSEGLFYWFAFHPTQIEFLSKFKDSRVAFGCGSPQNLILFPYDVFSQWLDKMNVTKLENRSYWHVHINGQNGNYRLMLKSGYENPNITNYKVM